MSDQSVENGLQFQSAMTMPGQQWQGSPGDIAFSPHEIKARLLNLQQPCYVVRHQGRIGVANAGQIQHAPNGNGSSGSAEVLLVAPPAPIERLGDPNFRAFHQVSTTYTTGAMANGIASAELVIAMGKANMMSSFGAAGLVPPRIEEAIRQIKQSLPNGPYAFNLIHSPSEDAIERGAVELYLKHDIRTVEASAFLDLTPHIVAYRAAGLSLDPAGNIQMKNRVIAKISRREVARKFLSPAPERILRKLVEQGRITEQQANLAQRVPMADDITAEADSGGHTDNRPLVSLLPSIIALRDDIQAEQQYAWPIRVGAAGGISTPASALASYMMGAAYIVTGSVNQGCVEAGASTHTKNLLAQADIADVAMAPAADMFEMGVKLQVLKRGTLFPMRAQKLYDLYKEYDSVEAIPAAERETLEKRIFRRSLNAVWADTRAYFESRDPEQIARAEGNPKRKMALIFRSYLGLSSRWSNHGEQGREIDYQIWCGPAMGAFNDWVRGTYLEQAENRRAVEVAYHIMLGTAYMYRVQMLRMGGLSLPGYYREYKPSPFAETVTA